MSTSTINCLCGAISIPFSQKLPAHTELCHCNPCRHTSGALYEGFADLTFPPPQKVLEKCTAYNSSDTHTRYFCTNCGTKLFINAHHRQDGTERDELEAWFALGGAIDPASDDIENVLSVDSHMWLADTGDGGISPFLTRLGDRTIPCYRTSAGRWSNDDVNAFSQSSEQSTGATDEAKEDMLKAECRCGGVSLRIQRANHADRSVSQFERYIPKHRDDNVENDNHFASMCVCRSCRLQFGVSLVPWLYIPPVQLINPHTGKQVILHRQAMSAAAIEANSGLTLKHYWSRKDICRSFCSKCGAAVSYTRDDRPEITNIAAGLMRADEGVMARSWISWQMGRISFKEEATDKSVMEAWRATAEGEVDDEF